MELTLKFFFKLPHKKECGNLLPVSLLAFLVAVADASASQALALGAGFVAVHTPAIVGNFLCRLVRFTLVDWMRRFRLG